MEFKEKTRFGYRSVLKFVIILWFDRPLVLSKFAVFWILTYVVSTLTTALPLEPMTAADSSLVLSTLCSA